MKIQGIDLKARPYDEATFDVLGQPVTFRAAIVNDYSEFDAIYPEPVPPTRVHRSGARVPVLDDKNFVKEVEKRGTARMVYMMAKSLLATPDLAFDHINLKDAETLTAENLDKEFSEMGLPDFISQQVMNLVTSANGLTQKAVVSARKSFFTTETDLETEPEAPAEAPSNE